MLKYTSIFFQTVDSVVFFSASSACFNMYLNPMTPSLHSVVRFHGNAILGASHVRDWREVLAFVEEMGKWMLQCDVVSALDPMVAYETSFLNAMGVRLNLSHRDVGVIYDTVYDTGFFVTSCMVGSSRRPYVS